MYVTTKFRNGTAEVEKSVEEPEICPVCEAFLKPQLLSAVYFKNNASKLFGVCVYLCRHCYNPFICTYDLEKSFNNLILTAPRHYSEKPFDDRIKEFTPKFVNIYNQALQAETLGLEEVAGIGYRKSLEFLIKDYLVKVEPDKKDAIERMELGNCIANKVENPRIKAVALRATWLGNDFAHYYRKFEEYEISDMKRFIEATLHWIELEMTTDEALAIEPRK